MSMMPCYIKKKNCSLELFKVLGLILSAVKKNIYIYIHEYVEVHSYY